MRTVGQILRETREANFYTLDQVEKATKIRKELLEALEAGKYNKLPPPTFVQGFIKNYGKFLKLDIEKLLAVFRREFSDRENPPKIMEAWSNPLTHSRFHLTPTRLISSVVVILILIFFSYLWFEYRFLAGSPTVEISSPEDQLTTQNALVQVSGKTDLETKVSINNQDVLVDSEGRFSADVELKENVNKLTVTSTSKFGKTTTIERTVYLKK